MSDAEWPFSPYDDKTIAEIVHDYAVVRGDLVEQYARDQLVDIIERRIVAAAAEADMAGWGRGYEWARRRAERYRLAWLSARRRARRSPRTLPFERLPHYPEI